MFMTGTNEINGDILYLIPKLNMAEIVMLTLAVNFCCFIICRRTGYNYIGIEFSCEEVLLLCGAKVLVGLAMHGSKQMIDEFCGLQYAGNLGFISLLVIKHNNLSSLSVLSDANILPWKPQDTYCLWFESNEMRTVC